MKKLFAVLAIAAIFTACNEESKTESTNVTTDSLTEEANKMADSANAMMNSTSDGVNKMTDTIHSMMNHATDSVK